MSHRFGSATAILVKALERVITNLLEINDVSAVAITAAASGQLGTTGASVGRQRGQEGCDHRGEYYKGLPIFTIAKGGAMVQAAVAGQKFTYKPKATS